MTYDYLNNDSIHSKYWGKHAWIFLNSIALTYDNNLKKEYMIFLNQLQYVLPCITCRKHFKEKLINLKDTDLENKETFLNWLLDVRNAIYIEQNRSIVDLDYNIDEIFNNNMDINMYLLLLLLFLILVFLIIIIILYKN